MLLFSPNFIDEIYQVHLFPRASRNYLLKIQFTNPLATASIFSSKLQHTYIVQAIYSIWLAAASNS